MEGDKQKRIIEHLVEKLTKLHQEKEVFDLFVKELREQDQMVGIPDRLHRIRNSSELKKRVKAYFQNLDFLILGTEKIPDHALRELIQRLQLDEGESN
jgi:hypothetical protein